MGCITTLGLEGLGLDCTDIPTGGIKNLYIANACDVAIGFVDKPIKIEYQEDGKTQVWEPNNSDFKFSGREMSLRWAMGRSVLVRS